MPAKNSIKTYLENGYYHIYNRGVEKRPIFLDQQDYGVFLSYLKEYLFHKQALRLKGETLQPRQPQPSSYSQYLGLAKAEWIKPEEILSYFSKTNPTLSYKTFVTENDDYGSLETILKNLRD